MIVFWIASQVLPKLLPAHDGHCDQSRVQSIRQLTLPPWSGQVAPERSAPSHSSCASATSLPHVAGIGRSVVVGAVVDVLVAGSSVSDVVVVAVVTVTGGAVVVGGVVSAQSAHALPSLESHSSPRPGSTMPSPHRDLWATM